MSDILEYLASFEEVDLSAYERVTDFDDGMWEKLSTMKGSMKRLKLPPSLLTITKSSAFEKYTQLTDVTFPSSLQVIGFVRLEIVQRLR
jgi:hypothetical protein